MPGANIIAGGAGNDTLAGGGGSDLLDGGTGVDVADYLGAAGSASRSISRPALLRASASTDALVGLENATGGAGADSLRGDGAANVLIGGKRQ